MVRIHCGALKSGSIARAQSLPAWLTPADRELVTRAADLYRQGKPDEANAQLQKFARASGKGRSVEQLDAVSRWALRTGKLASSSIS